MKILDDIATSLLEIDKITRWLLLLFITLFFVSGYSMVGKFGFHKLLPKELSARIHAVLDIPTIILLIIHCYPRIYFRVKRWLRG